MTPCMKGTTSPTTRPPMSVEASRKRRTSRLLNVIGPKPRTRREGEAGLVSSPRSPGPARPDDEPSTKTQRWLSRYEYPIEDRKSTRLNSSHDQISYAVFCLK